MDILKSNLLLLLILGVCLISSCQNTELTDLKRECLGNLNELLETRLSNIQLSQNDLVIDRISNGKRGHRARFIVEFQGNSIKETLSFELSGGNFVFDQEDLEEFADEIMQSVSNSVEKAAGLRIYKLKRTESFTLFNENPDMDPYTYSKVYDGGFSISTTVVIEREDSPGVMKVYMFQGQEDEKNLLSGTKGNTLGIVGYIREEFLSRFDLIGYYREDKEANEAKLKEQTRRWNEQRRFEQQRIEESRRATADKLNKMIQQGEEFSRPGSGMFITREQIAAREKQKLAAKLIKITEHSIDSTEKGCELVLTLLNNNEFTVMSVELHIQIRDSQGNLLFEDKSVHKDVSLESNESNYVRVVIGGRELCDRMVDASVLYQIVRAES